MITYLMKEYGCFLSYYPGRAVEQTVELPVIWEAMTPIWLHSSDNAADR